MMSRGAHTARAAGLALPMVMLFRENHQDCFFCKKVRKSRTRLAKPGWGRAKRAPWFVDESFLLTFGAIPRGCDSRKQEQEKSNPDVAVDVAKGCDLLAKSLVEVIPHTAPTLPF